MEPSSARKYSFCSSGFSDKNIVWVPNRPARNCGPLFFASAPLGTDSNPLNFIKLYDIICNNVIAERPVLNFLFPFLPAFFLFSAAAIFHIIHGDMILPILSPACAGLEQWVPRAGGNPWGVNMKAGQINETVCEECRSGAPCVAFIHHSLSSHSTGVSQKGHSRRLAERYPL